MKVERLLCGGSGPDGFSSELLKSSCHRKSSFLRFLSVGSLCFIVHVVYLLSLIVVNVLFVFVGASSFHFVYVFICLFSFLFLNVACCFVVFNL